MFTIKERIKNLKNIQKHKHFRTNISYILLIFFLAIGRSASAQFNFTIDTTVYNWMLPEFDSIQFFKPAAIKSFYKAWKNTSKEKLVVVYMGDSHVQPDILPGEFRKVLQTYLGDGGRGMVFPYSTANTYSSVGYKSTHKGKWTYAKSWIVPPKIPLGVTGMTSKTIDSAASFTLNFYSPLPDSYSKIRIYCKNEHESYDIKLECGGVEKMITVDSSFKNGEAYIETSIPSLKQALTLSVKKNHDYQSEFEFYGIDLMSTNDTGVIVHCVGVGASRYQAVLYEDLLKDQMPSLNADLVILDYGTNDYLYDDSIKGNLETEIIKGINIIKSAAPGATILLTSTHDMLYRYRKRYSGIKFSDLIKKIAKENNCLFFDWYWISGGLGTIKNMQQAGLAQKDGVHLTMSGYKLKGDILAKAFMNTISYLDQHPDADSLVLKTDSVKLKQQLQIKKENATQTVKNNSSATYYKIKKGDNLGSIAQKYGVTITQIKAWNNMHSDKIIAGKTLLIYKNKY